MKTYCNHSIPGSLPDNKIKKMLTPKYGGRTELEFLSSQKTVAIKTVNPIQSMLGRAHVEAICLHTDAKNARKILQESGMIAGEEYAYSFMDFEGSFSSFVRDMHQVHQNTGLPGWKVESFDEETGQIVLNVWHWKGCQPQRRQAQKNNSSLLCEYMQGFARGMLSAYAGAEYTATSCCCCQVDFKQKTSVCRYKLSPGDA